MKIKTAVTKKPRSRFAQTVIKFLNSTTVDDIFPTRELEHRIGYSRGMYFNIQELAEYRIFQQNKNRYLYGNKKALKRALKLLSQIE
jgi:hypothetical protein